MNDLISRQAAIDALETIGYDFSDSELSRVELEELCEAVGDVRQDMINRIKRLPSAERKKGKWIMNDNGTYSCSVCQSWIPEEQYHYARFCLYCGADMRGADDE